MIRMLLLALLGSAAWQAMPDVRHDASFVLASVSAMQPGDIARLLTVMPTGRDGAGPPPPVLPADRRYSGRGYPWRIEHL